MKKIFFGILAMAAFAACSNEEQIAAPQGEAIAFGNAFVDNSVRAVTATDPSYTTASLNHFDVYGAVNGVNIFDGDEVTGSVGSGAAWTFTDRTTPTQYWIPGANYTFHAVVDANDGVEVDDAGLPLYLKYTADGKTDMLHDIVTTTGKPTTNNGLVAFGFTHLLSKVKFTVENTTAEAADNYQYVISDIKITNAYASGNYAVVDQTIDETTVYANTWFGLVGGTHTIDPLTVASAKTEVGASEVLLIPGASVGVSFTVDIQMYNGSEWVSIPMDNSQKTIANVVTLEANKAYNFKVTLGLGDPIQFTATALDAWENGNTEDTSNPADGVDDIVPVVPAN